MVRLSGLLIKVNLAVGGSNSKNSFASVLPKKGSFSIWPRKCVEFVLYKFVLYLVVSVTIEKVSLYASIVSIVSNVLILSTTGIKSPPRVVDSLIFLQEIKKIIVLVKIAPSVSARCLYFTKKIYAVVKCYLPARSP